MLACQNFFMKKISSSFFKQKGDNEMNNSLDLSNSLKCVFVRKKRNSISKLCALFQRPPNVLHSKEAIAAQKERPLETPAPPLPCDLPPQQRRTAFSRTQGSEEIARPQPCLMMTFDNDTHTHIHSPMRQSLTKVNQPRIKFVLGSSSYQTILFPLF